MTENARKLIEKLCILIYNTTSNKVIDMILKFYLTGGDIMGKDFDESVLAQYEHEKYLAIASMSIDVLFEYDVNTDTMYNRLNRGGQFGQAVCMHNFSTEFLNRGLIMEDEVRNFELFIRALRGNDTAITGEFRYRMNEELQYAWCKIEGVRVRNEDGSSNMVVGKINNIEAEKKVELEEKEKTLKDSLTGMYNREAAIKVISRCIHERKEKEIMALFVIEVANFVSITQKMGRIFGDELLKDISDDIRMLFNEGDIIGRVGVDKFVILMRNAVNREHIQVYARMLVRVFENAYAGEVEEGMAKAIGIAVSPIDGELFDTLYEKADQAMVYARKNDAFSYEIYDEAKESEYIREYLENRRTEYIPVTELAVNLSGGDSLIQLAFKLVEETKDIDSAIKMLLRRVARIMNLQVISIVGVIEEPYVIKYLYQFSTNDRYEDNVGKNRFIPKNYWEKTVQMYRSNSGICVVDAENRYPGPEEIANEIRENGITAIVQCACFEDGEYTGRVDYADYDSSRVWTPEEIEIMKIITNIIFSYMLKMRAFETAKAQVERLNAYDQLTGLLKFERFQKAAELLMDEDKGKQYIVVYSDIYNFKFINEKYGYVEGDELLRKFAKSISNNNFKSVVSRVTSDNFIAFSAYHLDSNQETLDKLVYDISELNRQFEESVSADYPGSKILVCTGICVFDRNNTSLMAAISNANLARKKAKASEKTNCILYDAKMSEDIIKKAAYLSEIKGALANREFVVFIQPKVDAKTHEVVGGEALVRWRLPDGKLRFPGDFVPVFEENKMIKELDFYVYEETCRYIKSRLDNNEKVVPISVNASRIHLSDKEELVNYLKFLLDKYKVPAEYIEVELTENIFIEDMMYTVEVINSIRELGIKVSMDDFGSGYSSLNTLKRIPIDVLKLDKAFMDDIEDDCEEDIIISSIIDMAKKMGIKVLCEGVETAQQARLLANSGCDMIQGYYFSKPIDIPEFNAMLEK